MKHPLESENEELRKRIEDTFDEIERVKGRIDKYRLYRYAESTSIQNVFTIKTMFSNFWSKS